LELFLDHSIVCYRAARTFITPHYWTRFTNKVSELEQFISALPSVKLNSRFAFSCVLAGLPAPPFRLGAVQPLPNSCMSHASSGVFVMEAVFLFLELAFISTSGDIDATLRCRMSADSQATSDKLVQYCPAFQRRKRGILYHIDKRCYLYEGAARVSFFLVLQKLEIPRYATFCLPF
jgi:hypothetical protein